MSNSPFEPVRQKWIRETYTTLKSILPIESIDTPQELAQLSQFVVNIIDFRDPDCATTIFVNTDLITSVNTNPTNQNPPTLSFSNNTSSVNGVNGVNNAPANPFDPDFYFNQPTNLTTQGESYLVQYGMEYSPIAINEILAFQFFRNTNYNNPTPSTAKLTPRMFVELVNTLTQAANLVGRLDASDLDLYGWEFILLPDNNLNNRPHPITGQTTQPIEATYNRVVVMNGTQITPGEALTTSLYAPSQNSTSNPASPYPVPAFQAGNRGADPQASQVGANGITTSYYYVIANQYPQSPSVQANDENNPPTVAPPNGTPVINQDGQVALEFPNWNLFKTDGTGTDGLGAPLQAGQYYWLYLTRPSNPLDPTLPKVVVDSIRFPFTDAGYKVTPGTNGAPVTVAPINPNAIQQIYSLERIQPYRGGQAVPYNYGALTGNTVTSTAAVAPIPPTCYGYREQTVPCNLQQQPNGFGNYSGNFAYIQAGNPKPVKLLSTEANIAETLGNRNSTNENEDFMPFHDRDFMSVAELLLVPGCPPGLFTRQFAENSPPTAIPNAPYAYVTPPTNYPGQNGGVNDARNVGRTLRQPHVLGYLPDNFYYTAYGQSSDYAATTATPPGFGGPVIGGPSGAGWHRMLGFFEVPSTAIGATGTVGLGHDFDWYRQDRRPGQINLNLVIDEEVFFGILDDPLRMNMNPYNMTLVNPTFNPTPFAAPPYYPTTGGATPTPVLGNGLPPNIVTMINVDGSPAFAYPMNGRGFTYWMGLDPLSVNPIGVSNPPLPPTSLILGGQSPYPKIHPNLPTDFAVTGMKAAFADFLRLRHGGSNFLYGYGIGPTSSVYPLVPGPLNGPLPLDRPFHDITFPDIDFTVMRPATLPPSVNTNPTVTYAYSQLYPQTANTPPMPTPNSQTNPGYYAQDPGLKNPYVSQPMPPVAAAATSNTQYNFQPPEIPPRRLFQIPDMTQPNANTGIYPSNNASIPGDPNINNPVLAPKPGRPDRQPQQFEFLFVQSSGTGGKRGSCRSVWAAPRRALSHQGGKTHNPEVPTTAPTRSGVPSGCKRS